MNKQNYLDILKRLRERPLSMQIEDCPVCVGQGWTEGNDEWVHEQILCAYCNGTGYILRDENNGRYVGTKTKDSGLIIVQHSSVIGG